MSGKLVLVIEDEADIGELVKYNLENQGYRVILEKSGEQGLRTARSVSPNAIVLDLMLPGLNGIDVCKRLKADQATRHIPVVMLTAKAEDTDVVLGLEVGADDYITKPFSPRVLIARLRAALRRKEEVQADTGAPIRIHELVIDPKRHQVLVEGKNVTLTMTEFKTLYLLAGRPGWVFTRDQMVDATRGDDAIVTDRSVDVHIAGLRKKLGSCGKYIETVRGVGYRFME